MESDEKQDGRAANIKGESRTSNPYTGKGFNYTPQAVEWDLGWLMQTQHWAGKPEKMCKGRKCTAMRGIGHSKECIEDHEAVCAGMLPYIEI